MPFDAIASSRSLYAITPFSGIVFWIYTLYNVSCFILYLIHLSVNPQS
ncbi:MAG: hypothetical protein E5299_00773 [Burkholderia gladioli]|nr:MAG: hypothetical protein E5299_00773 [Burkholderia gladioli]